MKKTTLVTVFAMALFSIYSCTKKDDSGAATTNSWKLGATTYNAVGVTRTSSGSTMLLLAMDGLPVGTNPQVNGLSMWFATPPTASGTYKIVQFPGTTLTGNQLGLSAGLYAATTTYTSTGTDNISATVTITGGKIKISIPDVWVKKTTGTDSLKLSANLTEQ